MVYVERMFENNVVRIDNGNNTKRDVGLDIIFYYNDDDDDDYTELLYYGNMVFMFDGDDNT